MHKERESNIELLRIIAMFLVLLVHADFFSLGAPTKFDIQTNFVDSVLRVFFQSLSIACVDIFVFISGWFGIKPKVKGLCNYIFQCLFFLIGIYIVCLIVGLSDFSINGIRGCFAATGLNWFIKAYLLLYIISPVLNLFVENTKREQFKSVLLAFYIFQFFYGWVFPSSTAFICDGYSTISFIGLYLLARYIHIYQPSFTSFSISRYFSLIMLIIICVTILYLCIPEIGNKFLNYISPSTLLISIFTVLSFSKIKIQSNFINWCGASSFAVFLLHTNPNIIWHFQEMCLQLHGDLSPFLYWGVISLALMTIFIIALFIDQIRIYIWNKLWPYITQ